MRLFMHVSLIFEDVFSKGLAILEDPTPYVFVSFHHLILGGAFQIKLHRGVPLWHLHLRVSTCGILWCGAACVATEGAWPFRDAFLYTICWYQTCPLFGIDLFFTIPNEIYLLFPDDCWYWIWIDFSPWVQQFWEVVENLTMSHRHRDSFESVITCLLRMFGWVYIAGRRNILENLMWRCLTWFPKAGLFNNEHHLWFKCKQVLSQVPEV